MEPKPNLFAMAGLTTGAGTQVSLSLATAVVVALVIFVTAFLPGPDVWLGVAAAKWAQKGAGTVVPAQGDVSQIESCPCRMRQQARRPH